MSRHTLRLSLLTSLTLFLVFLIFTDLTPLLRGPAPETSEWYWPYLLRPLSRWWLPVVSAVLLLGIVGWWLKRPEQSKKAVLGLVVANFLLQLALIYADRPAVLAELVDRTLSERVTGYFQPAVDITTLDAFLTNYPQKMPHFTNDHARTHPPGLILLNWLSIQAFSIFPSAAEPVAQQIRPLRCTDLWLLEQPPSVVAGLALSSILPMLFGALTIVPGFLLARRLLSSQTAPIATALIASLPALLVFAPNNVQIDAFLALTAVLALSLGLKGRSGWFFIGGLLLSAATFLSLGNAAVLLPLAAFIVGSYTGTIHNIFRGHWNRPAGWRGWVRLKIWRRMLAFGLGSAALWLLLWTGWGVQPWEVANVGLEQHYQLVTAERRYEWWLLYNLVDLVLYAGLPLLFGFLGSLAAAGRNMRSREIRPVGALALGLGLLVITLDLSGSTRGEVGRLWLFFMPLLALPAAVYLEKMLNGRRAVMLIIGLQLLLALSIGLAWRPMQAVIVVAERPEMAATEPNNNLNITFLEPESGRPLLRLAGFDARYTPAQPEGFIDLTLYWEAVRPAQRPYTIFNHLTDSQGNVVAQKDNWPVNGQWPPTCWQAGEEIVDPYRIELPADLAPGLYKLVTGVYDAADSQRLVDEDGKDSIELFAVAN